MIWGNDPHQVLPAESIAQLKALGATLVCVLPQTQRDYRKERISQDVIVLGDHTGAVKRWFDHRPTPVIFLRPDKFVAGACLVQHAPATVSGILAAMHRREQVPAATR